MHACMQQGAGFRKRAWGRVGEVGAPIGSSPGLPAFPRRLLKLQARPDLRRRGGGATPPAGGERAAAAAAVTAGLGAAGGRAGAERGRGGREAGAGRRRPGLGPASDCGAARRGGAMCDCHGEEALSGGLAPQALLPAGRPAVLSARPPSRWPLYLAGWLAVRPLLSSPARPGPARRARLHRSPGLGTRQLGFLSHAQQSPLHPDTPEPRSGCFRAPCVEARGWAQLARDCARARSAPHGSALFLLLPLGSPPGVLGLIA